MKKIRAQAKAKAVDTTKDKIIFGGLALLAGLMAMAMFSSTTQAKTPKTWSSYSVGEGNTKLPFKLKSQLLGH